MRIKNQIHWNLPIIYLDILDIIYLRNRKIQKTTRTTNHENHEISGNEKKQESHCDGLTCFCPIPPGPVQPGQPVILKINWEHFSKPSNCNELQ